MNPCSYNPNANEKNLKKKEKKRKKGKETYVLESVPLESFEPEVRRASLTSLLHPREGVSPRLRRGIMIAHQATHLPQL